MALGRTCNAQNSTLLICIVISLMCFIHCSCAVEVIKQNSDKPSSYFDFLDDVRVRIQQENNFKQSALLGDVSKDIRRLSYSMARYFTDVEDGSNNIEKASGLLGLFLDSVSDNSTSSACINDTGRLVTGLVSGEPWAFQFFDATGKPGPSISQFRVYFMGNYDQCRHATALPVAPEGGENGGGGFRGNYCVINMRTNIPILVPILGVCVPSTCSSSQISSLAWDMLKGVRIGNITFEGATTECLEAKTKVTAATVLSIIILSVVGVMIIVGTAFDILMMNEGEKEQTDLAKDHQHNQQPQQYANIDEVSPLLPPPSKALVDHSVQSSQSLTLKVLRAFSVYSNGKKLLNSSQPPGSLTAIHGIRFLSMSWVVLCHTYGQVIFSSSNSFAEYAPLLNRWTFLPISNGFVSVDTFFTLSGLLTSYLTVKEMMKRNTWKINWPMFYFHRFWRLTPPYMFILVIVLGLQQYLGQGPLWRNEQPSDKGFCEKNWWTNLLYVNNLLRTDEACFGHSWYLANDVQFFVLSPLMLIPFYFHRLAGVVSCCVFLLATWITTGVLSTTNDWPTTSASLKPSPEAPHWMNDYYLKPWCRIGPFVVGILAGYVLAMSKGRPFRMRWWVVSLGWLLSVGSGLAVVYGLRGDITGDHVSSTGAASFYNLISRSVWGGCVSWVIIACSAGYGGPINKLLSWSPFVMLGRLTYMSYLIHICLLYVFFQNLDGLLVINDTTVAIIFLGLLLFVNMVSFVFVLALESPMVGLERALLRKERK